MTTSPPRLLCVGYGYCAAVFGRTQMRAGWRVAGTTRREEKAAALRAAGVAALLDDDVAGVAQAAAEADAILVSAGPDAEGDPTLRRHRAAIETALAGARLKWLGYLSTTGVYGDHGGGWVDEATPRAPSTARGAARVAAEDAWLALGGPMHIFRLAGIYGPGRGPFEKVRRGAARRIIKPGQVFSRIHVDDIGATLAASIAQPCAGAAYNVCDDDPAPPQDVLAHAAALLGLPAPPEVDFDVAKETMSPMAASFYAESKRVSNRRIKDGLGVRLRYPSYRDGLPAVLAAETAAGGDEE